MTEALQRLKMFIRDHAPTLLEGEVLEVKQSTIQVKVNFESKELIFSDAKLLCNNEISFSPEVGSKVLVGFINKKWNSPIVLGSISSYSEDKVSITKKNKNISISPEGISINSENGLLNIGNNKGNISSFLNDVYLKIAQIGILLKSIPIPNTLDVDAGTELTKLSSIFSGVSSINPVDIKANLIKANPELEKMLNQ